MSTPPPKSALMTRIELGLLRCIQQQRDLSHEQRMAFVDNELAEIRALALAAQHYEQQKYTVAAPVTLGGMIEMRMYEMRLKQKDLAKKLNISDAKLSLIMNGKQRPDVDFLKAVHTELHVDAEFILQHV